jgi:hypothetical protein
MVSFLIKAIQDLHRRCKAVPFTVCHFPKDPIILGAIYRLFLNDGIFVSHKNRLPLRAYGLPYDDLTFGEQRSVVQRAHEFVIQWRLRARDKYCPPYLAQLFEDGKAFPFLHHNLLSADPQLMRKSKFITSPFFTFSHLIDSHLIFQQLTKT